MFKSTVKHYYLSVRTASRSGALNELVGARSIVKYDDNIALGDDGNILPLTSRSGPRHGTLDVDVNAKRGKNK